jgi:hypothetical protein
MAQWYVDVTEKELCKLKIQLYLVRNLLRCIIEKNIGTYFIQESYKWEIAFIFMKHQQLKNVLVFINLYSENEKKKRW